MINTDLIIMEEKSYSAEKYFKEHNSKFTPFLKGSFQNVEASKNTLMTSRNCPGLWTADRANNQVFITEELIKLHMFNSTTYKDVKTEILGRNLYKNIREKSYLIGELEYINGCKRRDISEEIYFLTSEIENFVDSLNNVTEKIDLRTVMGFWFEDSCPILYFATALKHLISPGCRLIIVASKNRAALCTLIIEICIQSGFSVDMFSLIFVESKWFDEVLNHNFFNISLSDFLVKRYPKIENKGTCMIIENTEDIKLVIDILIDRPFYLTPWTVKRLMIHESVYTEFRRLLEKRIRGKPVNKLSQAYQQRCSDYTINIETTIIDSTQNRAKVILWHKSTAESGDVCTINSHVFKTTAHLLDLIKEDSFFGLSLWSGNEKFLTEVCNKVKSNHVWIESFGLFDSKSSVITPSIELAVGEGVIKDLKAGKERWKNMPAEVKREKLDYLKIKKPCGIIISSGNAVTINGELSVSSLDGCLITKIVQGTNETLFLSGYELTNEIILTIKKAFMEYNGIIVKLHKESEDAKKWFNFLTKKGLPIIQFRFKASENLVFADFEYKYCPSEGKKDGGQRLTQNVKTIWTLIEDSYTVNNE